MRFGSTAKVPAECKLKYCRISEYGGALQAPRTGKAGRRSSILGIGSVLAKTVGGMWPFNRPAIQAAAASALPEGEDIMDAAADSVGATGTSGAGPARVSPRILQANERALHEGELSWIFPPAFAQQ